MTDRSIYAYIDETGDLGGDLAKARTSPIFGMACVMVSPEAALNLRAAVETLREDFGVRDSVKMSWKDNIRTHDRRMHAARTLATVPGVTIVYVFTDKRVVTGSYVSNRGSLYNYVAGKAYRGMLWAARNAGADACHLRFGQVAHFDHSTTRDYFEGVLDLDPKVPSGLVGGLKWVSADQYLESQAADAYAGFLAAAVWPDRFGGLESLYLKSIWHQVRTGGNGCKIPLGFMSMPSHDVARGLPWWDCSCAAC